MADTTQLTDKAAHDLSRRDFVALSVAGIAAATTTASGAGLPVTETDVTIQTPDGTCDAAFIYPAAGTHPAVIIWPDAFGLRVSMREMAKRLAADGYSVLVPNPYYRVAKSPVFGDISRFNFSNPADRNKLTPLMGSINADGAAEKDATAFTAWLDKQKPVDTSKPIGTQGYCMGGPLVMRTAAAVPGRVQAVGSFHGGGLVTDAPNSPHLLAPKMKARVYVAGAIEDQSFPDDMKVRLEAALTSADVDHTVETYPARHGWVLRDTPVFDAAAAERHWQTLVALFRDRL